MYYLAYVTLWNVVIEYIITKVAPNNLTIFFAATSADSIVLAVILVLISIQAISSEPYFVVINDMPYGDTLMIGLILFCNNPA